MATKTLDNRQLEQLDRARGHLQEAARQVKLALERVPVTGAAELHVLRVDLLRLRQKLQQVEGNAGELVVEHATVKELSR
jgi:hypothetical protein